MHQSCKSKLKSHGERLDILESNRFDDFNIELGHIHRKMRDMKLSLDQQKEFMKRVMFENESLKKEVSRLSSVVSSLHGDKDKYENVSTNDKSMKLEGKIIEHETEDVENCNEILEATSENMNETKEETNEINGQRDTGYNADDPICSEELTSPQSSSKKQEDSETKSSTQESCFLSNNEEQSKNKDDTNLEKKAVEVSNRKLLEDFKTQHEVLKTLTEDVQEMKSYFIKGMDHKQSEVFSKAPEKKDNAVESEGICRKKTKRIQCWYCPRKFQILQGLMKHMIVIHPNVDIFPKYSE